MKFILLAFFSLYPFLQVKSSTPKSVTCTRTEYREEYIPGTGPSNPGYVKNYEIDVEVPCGGEKAKNIDDNDCSEGSVIGGLLGAGIALSSSRGKDRFWAVPAGGTAGALIGCQVDGG
ncbi:glycine zipper 2TM domain-containing protein [Prochlorococcus sp. AH-716-N14]|nr:glycine zipper 2TM domain-containing protein [Prochlorococcus sp. AH-716-N14]